MSVEHVRMLCRRNESTSFHCNKNFVLDILNLFLEMFSESKIKESFFRIRETPRKDAKTMHLYK